MHATYSLPSDKLKVWFDDRLSTEDYQRARKAGFVYWHGSKCFVSKWSTQAEDFIKSMGIDSIEADDRPDDVEARVDRFSKYAESAERQAESSQTYLDERANTERRRANAINGIEKGLALAEHWQDRIAGAIRNAQYKERPDVIARRIEGLEKSRRKFVADSTPDTKVDGARYGAGDSVWVGQSRGGHWLKKSKLPEVQAWAQRWIEHIDRRLEYERACLQAAGGIVAGLGAAPLDRVVFEKDGAVQTEGEWRIITKVNKKTVEYFNPSCHWRKYWKVDRTRIQGVKTFAEVKAELPDLLERYQAHKDQHRIAIQQQADMERDHMATLDEMSKPRKYSQLGAYDREQVRLRLASSLLAKAAA